MFFLLILSRFGPRRTQVQKRDPKGLYAKVAAGEIKSFTGMSADAPYEAPLHPEVDFLMGSVGGGRSA